MRPLLILALLLLPTSLLADSQRIAFGSCLKQAKPQPVWDTIRSTQPELFLFMGDNVYVDTSDPDEMHDKYAELADNERFQQAKAQFPIMAIWDDHDYGKNDAGREFAAKSHAKQAFLRFFDVPDNDPRHTHAGLYHSKLIEQDGGTVQIIMLDTRWFRDFPPAQSGNQQATLLGNTQWQWLEEQLKQPADLRLLVSSIQVIPEEHRWEKWANFPAERQKLLTLLKDTRANGVVLLSGDRHLAEITLLKPQDSGLNYPLYEITASGMNSAIGWLKGDEDNRHRLGKNYRSDHFGLIDIDWQAEKPTLTVQIRHATRNSVALEQRIALQDLQP